MIRHARRRLPAKPILALPVAMIEPSFFAALVPPVGAAPLMETGLLSALRTAVAMPTITVRADKENRVTVLPAACALQQLRFIMGRQRRHRRPAGVDNSSTAMSG
jgi:hypothetical protein